MQEEKEWNKKRRGMEMEFPFGNLMVENGVRIRLGQSI